MTTFIIGLDTLQKVLKNHFNGKLHSRLCKKISILKCQNLKEETDNWQIIRMNLKIENKKIIALFLQIIVCINTSVGPQAKMFS